MAQLTHGMNSGAVRDGAANVQTAAGELEAQIQRATQAVNTLMQNWFGSDATQFDGQWRQDQQMIMPIVDELRKFAKMATDEADQQDTASA